MNRTSIQVGEARRSLCTRVGTRDRSVVQQLTLPLVTSARSNAVLLLKG